MTGAAFLLHSLCQVLQYAWGGVAMAAGGQSAVMAAYLRWAPALNHSRTFLLLGFCAALVVFAFQPAAPTSRFWAAYATLLLAAQGLGAGLGYLEGSLLVRRHFLAVASWDTIELMVLLGALLAVLKFDRADRLLWAALATYAFSVALSILWFTVLSRFGLPGEWTPSPAHMAGYRAATMAATFAFAFRRHQLARRRVEVPGLSPGPRSVRPRLAQ